MAPPSLLHPFARPTAERFVPIVRGEGAAVFDAGGRRYVDGLASLWYCNAGHGRPEIVDAVTRQMRALENYNLFDIFTNEPADLLADRVAALAPVPEARVFLTCSGSEAVDTALKLARLTFQRSGEPQRQLVVSRTLGYHGTTVGGTSLQGLPLNRAGWGQLLGGTATVPHDDLEAAADLLAARGGEVAAVVAEPVIGAGGVHPAPPGYLAGLRKLCDEHGALLVLDEVITGFGRLGAWFAADLAGVTPDMIVFAKAVTSGYQPLGGVVIGPRVRAALEDDDAFVLRHGYTYSGHPTACAAALANLDVLRDEGLLDRAAHIADRLGGGLRRLHTEGAVAGVRGEGGMWAVDVLPGTDPVAVRDAMLDRGVIARPIGTATVAFCPPLVIDDDDLDLCVGGLAASLAEVAPPGRVAPA
ncbi:MAG TPA: aminotransferase class III-fold pyridoxal phosphate-dependent enzyme [Acidimicrobiales bacterium]